MNCFEDFVKKKAIKEVGERKSGLNYDADAIGILHDSQTPSCTSTF